MSALDNKVEPSRRLEEKGKEDGRILQSHLSPTGFER